MWKNKEVHFATDVFFDNQSFAETTAPQVSLPLELGCTEGGLRVHGYIEGTGKCTESNTITTKLQVGDKNADGEIEWADLETRVVTATGTSISGDIFSVIPETDKHFMRVSVANSEGMTGSFSVYPEYVPR